MWTTPTSTTRVLTPDRLGLALRDEIAAVGVSPTLPQIDRLTAYLGLIARWRSRARLTAVADHAEAARLHIADSLLCLRTTFTPGSSVVDVGSGAGLPGIPLAIVRDDLRVTLLEPDRRKAAFLEGAVAELDLRAAVLAVPAEEAGRGRQRESFDIAVARAVAPLVVSCELTLPLVRVGGRVVLLKGPSVTVELGGGRGAARVLGGSDLEVSEWTLRGGERRLLVVIRKDHPTPPGYPRRVGVPRKRPLNG